MATQTKTPATLAATVLEADLPNGPVAAALVAGGIGCAAIGLLTTLAEASVTIKDSLNWYNPVGPLTGKTLLGVIIFALAWGVLGFMYRGKNVNFARASALSFTLLAVALITTFPPFFELFAAE
jgi:hypothetical protein